MATYLELKEKAEQLLLEAERLRQQEVEKVILEIFAQMEAYGLTLADLSSRKSPAVKTPPKYRGPNGELWAGGRGRKPDWILAAIHKGESIEQFRIKP